MPKIEIRKDESIDKALKKFKMALRREGTIDEIKRRECYQKPSERRRENKAKAVRRERRRQREDA
jgi:small subunit ribosomal protein S21